MDELFQGWLPYHVFRYGKLVDLAADVEEALLQHEAVTIILMKDEYVPVFKNAHVLDNLRTKHLSVRVSMTYKVRSKWISDLTDAFCSERDHALKTLDLDYVEPEIVPKLFGRFESLSLLNMSQDAVEQMALALLDPGSSIVQNLRFSFFERFSSLERVSTTVSWDEKLVFAITRAASLRSLSCSFFVELPQTFFTGLASPYCSITDLHLNGDTLPGVISLLQNPYCRLRNLSLTEVDNFDKMVHQLFSLVRDSKLEHFTLSTDSYIAIQELQRTLLRKGGSLRSLALETRCEPVDMSLYFRTDLTHLRLSLMPIALSSQTEDNYLFRSAQQFVDLLAGSRVTHFGVDKWSVQLVPVAEQRKLVAYFEDNIDIPLEALELYDWESEALRKGCEQILKRNKLFREGGLLEEGLTQPLHAKLFLCGEGGVGKTTIRKNLCRKFSVPKFLQSSKSTCGIKLQSMSFGDKKLMICDLAGQPEYHVFHHYFIRGSDKDLFLLVCKAPSSTDDPAKLENHLRYWLRFIVAHRSLSEERPRVLILFNYFPQSESSRTLSRKEQSFIQCSTVIREYSRYVDFGAPDQDGRDSVYGLEALKVSEVKELKRGLETALTSLLERRPKIPVVCNKILKNLNATLARPKVLSVEEFRPMYGMRKFGDKLFKACVLHLHDIAELVYFEQHESGDEFVILEVQWFVQEVIEIFLPRDLSLRTSAGGSGVYPVANVQAQIADKCQGTDRTARILSSLQKLGVILMDESSESVTVLSLLGERLQGWEHETRVGTHTFWGRRLDCDDPTRTLLPSGIFHMLQVRLAKLFSQHRVGQGWLYLVENRVHVIVKIGGTCGEWYDMHWIDILIRIPFQPDDSLLHEAEGLYQQVKRCTEEVCGALNWGCPAIKLEEKVIRPEVVKENPSSVPTDSVHPLMQLVATGKEKGTLTYEHTWPSFRSNPVFELLLPSERDHYFAVKQRELAVIENEILECLREEDNNCGTLEVAPTEMKSELMAQIKKSEVRIISEIVEQVKRSELRITSEIQRLELVMREQMNSLQHQAGKIMSKLRLHFEFEEPKYPYFKDENNILQRVSQTTFGSTTRLHFLCEETCHQVANQTGILIKVTPEWFIKSAPVLIPAIRILFFAVKVAGVAGLGIAIPTPSKNSLEGMLKGTIQATIENIFGKLDESLKSKLPTKDELQDFHTELKKLLRGRDMEADFGLRRKINSNSESVWLCKEHYNND